MLRTSSSRFVAALLVLEFLATVGPTHAASADRAGKATGPSRDYDLSWTVHVNSVPAGSRMARVWVAVPQSLPEQRVSALSVTTPYRHTAVTDPVFHNRAIEVTVPHPPGSFDIALRAHVRRAPVGPRSATLTAAQRKLYLRHEALVSLSPRVHALADSVGGSERARYDYVIASMDYDKVTPGWGNGDTERACDVHRGNCTDYHSLFMSLSRAEGVPAYFEMGYPTKPEGEKDVVGGYHCWAWFYDAAEKAWTPVDISEADKHPEKREFFYGHLDADRITFSRGRDVKLPGMQGPALNYFPAGAYVEVDGTSHSEVTRTISYTVK